MNPINPLNMKTHRWYLLFFGVVWCFFLWSFYGVELEGISGFGAAILLVLQISLITLIYSIFYIFCWWKKRISRRQFFLFMGMILLPIAIVIFVENVNLSDKSTQIQEVKLIELK